MIASSREPASTTSVLLSPKSSADKPVELSNQTDKLRPSVDREIPFPPPLYFAVTPSTFPLMALTIASARSSCELGMGTSTWVPLTIRATTGFPSFGAKPVGVVGAVVVMVDPEIDAALAFAVTPVLALCELIAAAIESALEASS